MGGDRKDYTNLMEIVPFCFLKNIQNNVKQSI